MTQTETSETKRTPRRPPGPAHWLVARNEMSRIEVLTLNRNGEEQILPVFSHEEEAQRFLRLGSVGEDWRVGECGAEELVGVLYGPCAGVKEVALDPLPEMVAESTLGLVSLPRERFIGRMTARSRASGSAGGARGSRRTGSLPNTPQGASSNLDTSHRIGFPRRNHCC